MKVTSSTASQWAPLLFQVPEVSRISTRDVPYSLPPSAHFDFERSITVMPQKSWTYSVRSASS